MPPMIKPGARGGLTTPTGLDDFLDEKSLRGQVVGSWGFNANIDFTRMSAEQSNVWFFEQIFNFLRSFFGLVVPDNMEISTTGGKRQVTRDNLNQMTFLDELMLVMKGLSEPIWCIRLNLNIVGFLRTEYDPDKPVRLHIQEPASFIVWGGPDETGFQTFSLGYRLFAEQKMKGEHTLLWSMNQPLLEKGLRKWERQSRRRIEVVRGNSDDLPLYRHGFSKPAPARPRAKPKPRDEGPVVDTLPDFDDLML
ncbi:MAG: hypothetical protein JXA24_02375 [Proteobacteria bacterium]|nr:hypothetical protein [Pseudomonadota bacterium]